MMIIKKKMLYLIDILTEDLNDICTYDTYKCLTYMLSMLHIKSTYRE